jgi:hypothetical protein
MLGGRCGGLLPPACSVRPGFSVPDKSLPTIDLTYRLVLEINRAVGALPRYSPGFFRESRTISTALGKTFVAKMPHRV